jgi:PKD repeat protein
MRLHTRWSAALCSGLVILAACDSSHAPLAPQPERLSAPRVAAAPSGLVAFYPFDQPTGNGDVARAVHQPAGGYEGGAFHFNGTDAYIDLPVNVNPSVRRSVTMGAWMRAESIPSGRPAQLLSHDNGGYDRSIALDPRGVPGGEGGGGALLMMEEHRVSAFTGYGVLGGPVAETGRWVFVAAVYDGDRQAVDLYVDGAVSTTYAAPADGVPTLRVGGNPAGAPGGEPFHGSIDNVFVYDRALSADEVNRIRAGGACVITGTCVEPRRMAFYPFDTGPGDGIVTNALHQSAAGYEGGAYYFDGDGDYIDLPVDVNPSAMAEVTMGAWVRIESLPDDRRVQVLSHDDGAFDRSLGLDPQGGAIWWPVEAGYQYSAFTGAGVLPGPAPSIDTWTFVAAVYDGETVTLHVNGEQFTTTGSPGEGVRQLRVGGNPGGSVSGEPFQGWIDNVFVVNRALSAGEIAAIRAGGACVLAGTPCNRAPTVGVGGPYAAAEGSPVALALTAADPDGDALSLSWSLGDGTVGTGALPASHTYADNGSYAVTLTATDPSGRSATASTTVQVANVRPSVAGVAGASLVVGERYTAAVSFTDPGADGWTATVDYGDGSGAQPLALAGKGATLAHTYTVPGTYLVRVSVRDDDDATPGTDTATVVVSGLGGAIIGIVELVPAATGPGELTVNDARQVVIRLEAAASFIVMADGARQPGVRQVMLRNAVNKLDHTLDLLGGGGRATTRVRVETIRVRTLVQGGGAL